MKVLFDYQILATQRYGGISRYFYELITNLKNCGVETSIKCFFNRNSYFEDYFGKKYNPVIDKIKGKGFVNRLYMKMILRIGHYDIFHPTYYDNYFLSDNKGKLVITVYDMIHEILPEYFSSDDSTIQQKKQLIYKADHIIAISESTKRDILKIYPDIPESKISVIYIASNFVSCEDEQIDKKFPHKYILFVGSRYGYKNYKAFFEAVRPILNEDTELSLVCLGGGKFSDEETKLHGKLKERAMQMDVNDNTLSYAYSHAECFVFPSLYEGFGIPTLEAFACKCPVVLSSTSSMPEVGGDAAVYINPTDVHDMTESIKRVLENYDLRKIMRERGLQQLKKFNWGQIALETADCYRKVLKGESTI